MLAASAEPVIRFATINTSVNDLPWAFTAFTTPSVIYVPAGSGNRVQNSFLFFIILRHNHSG
jgi:hypothetical protein